MHRRSRRKAVGWTVAITSTCGVLSLAPSALAARPDGSDFSCRGSAARVTVKQPAAAVIEPIVANSTDAPCRADSAAVLTPTPIGPVTVDAANASTAQNPADLASAPAADGDTARADASVTNPTIAVPGLTITATVLSASASYTCRNGQPTAAGSSVVTNLTVNGQAISVPAGNAPFTLDLGPLGSLSVNQTTQAPNRITRRALSLTTPLTDVVIAEATADFTGNPCAPPAARPQCSDGVDNDGDGRIDAQDPGCLSGPGGSYNPNDNDETNAPPAARPQCSDGVDNDGDGRIDFPKDRGCSSPTDRSERTPSGRAKLTSRPPAIARLGLRGSCTRGSFAARVTGRSIRRVVFYFDSRRIRTDRNSPFTARIRTASTGRHRVTARVTFRSDSRTRSRKLSFRFRRCAPPVRFTG